MSVLLFSLVAWCIADATASAADLTPATAAAFDRYVARTESRMDDDLAHGRFLWTDGLAPADRQVRIDALERGALVIERLQTADRGRTMTVPDGLVHHWVGLAFVPGATLDRTLALLQDYDRHAAVYAPRIARSRLRTHAGDTFTFHLRFAMTKVITVVVNTENRAQFTRLAPDRVVSRIVGTRLAEIDEPGTPQEHERPVGHDGGYLWRLHTYWHLLERDGGTYIQCESISLTRAILPGLGWLVGPFVTSLPRESLEFTLATTRIHSPHADMARIVLTCWGSHGDIDPFLGLGLALRARGHQVTIATMEYFREVVGTAGLGFRPIRPVASPSDTTLIEKIMDPVRGSEFLLREILFPAIEQTFEDVDAAADGADLLVSHPVTFATPIVATRRRLPWASAVLAPASMFSIHDYPALPPAPWVKAFQRFGTWPGRLIIGAARRATAQWAEPVYRFRERLGLPRGGNPILEGQHSPDLVLVLYSRLLGAPQPDWPPHATITGHVFHDAPHGTSLTPDLTAWLDAGPAPFVFTLGSSVVTIAKTFWQESLDAVRRLDARAVLLAGPRAVDLQQSIDADTSLRGRVVAVERAPHSLISPRAAAIIQQCGIGTLAQGLRSGRPMLAVPYAHDQPDNAWRARALGVSRTLYPRQYSGTRVARELRALLDDERYATAATHVANAVKAEGGVHAACDALEQTFISSSRVTQP
ncbi:MAG: glycosyltransferase [Vicinamibacterales bacterium]